MRSTQVAVTPRLDTCRMATCIDCEQDMTTADGCTISELTLGERRYPRLPVGSEPGWNISRCGDCGSKRGHHHHLGCDIARCPACSGQLFSCGCAFAEYGVDELFEMIVSD